MKRKAKNGDSAGPARKEDLPPADEMIDQNDWLQRLEMARRKRAENLAKREREPAEPKPVGNTGNDAATAQDDVPSIEEVLATPNLNERIEKARKRHARVVSRDISGLAGKTAPAGKSPERDRKTRNAVLFAQTARRTAAADAAATAPGQPRRNKKWDALPLSPEQGRSRRAIPVPALVAVVAVILLGGLLAIAPVRSFLDQAGWLTPDAARESAIDELASVTPQETSGERGGQVQGQGRAPAEATVAAPSESDAEGTISPAEEDQPAAAAAGSPAGVVAEAAVVATEPSALADDAEAAYATPVVPGTFAPELPAVTADVAAPAPDGRGWPVTTWAVISGMAQAPPADQAADLSRIAVLPTLRVEPAPAEQAAAPVAEQRPEVPAGHPVLAALALGGQFSNGGSLAAISRFSPAGSGPDHPSPASEDILPVSASVFPAKGPSAAVASVPSSPVDVGAVTFPPEIGVPVVPVPRVIAVSLLPGAPPDGNPGVVPDLPPPHVVPEAVNDEPATGPDPAKAAYTVRLHAPSGVERGQVDSIAEVLRQTGYRISDPKIVNFTISRSNVRYFHPQDKDAARELAEAAGARLRDFTDFRPLPPQGLIEIWLQGRPAGAGRRTARRTPSTDGLSALRNQLIQRLRNQDYLPSGGN